MNSLIEIFSNLEDPRVERHKKHKLVDIIVLTICAVISGSEGWEAIETFGKAKLDWLRKYIELENGIPSHDCIARVISRLEPSKMSECFIKWARNVANLTDGEIVSIDGKTARGSYNDKDKMGAIHMVSAWANQAGISMGQVKTDAKSNEISAIPELLDLLAIKGCIVTIDAMGCQTDIAEKIIEKGADYVLAVKDNQPQLHEAIQDYFDVAIAKNDFEQAKIQCSKETVDAGHGRIEVRRYYLATCLDTLPRPSRWKGIKSIGMVESVRIENGKTSTECRHYVNSIVDVNAFGRAVRGHWGVENCLHWVLDVIFKEDESRIRTGHSPANFNVVRQIAINLLKKEDTPKLSIKRKRFLAGLDDFFRDKILRAA
jgi:predicted transposase YbfD/YdcC